MSLICEPITTLFVQVPDVTPRRVLHPCHVLDAGGRLVTLQSDEPLEHLVVGSTLLIYFEERQLFVQQPARVRELGLAPDGGDGDLLRVEFLAAPVNAEQRQIYRVSCSDVQITATMNQEAGCRVVDISATGFGVHCAGRFHVGSAVAAQLHWDGETVCGSVIVVSLRELSKTHQRYGVRSTCGADGRMEPLSKSLTRISLAVHREQMRRVG